MNFDSENYEYPSTKLRDFEWFYIIGPCSNELSGCRGTPCFMKSLEALEVQCTCLPKHSTTEDGRCYQPYTRGPCPWVNDLLYFFLDIVKHHITNRNIIA